jgi:short-subunit dehydrogenase involved in D-alanine esterification of teichoic acids
MAGGLSGQTVIITGGGPGKIRMVQEQFNKSQVQLVLNALPCPGQCP